MAHTNISDDEIILALRLFCEDKSISYQEVAMICRSQTALIRQTFELPCFDSAERFASIRARSVSMEPLLNRIKLKRAVEVLSQQYLGEKLSIEAFVAYVKDTYLLADKTPPAEHPNESNAQLKNIHQTREEKKNPSTQDYVWAIKVLLEKVPLLYAVYLDGVKTTQGSRDLFEWQSSGSLS